MPTKAYLSNLFSKTIVCLFIIFSVVFATIRLWNLANLLYASTSEAQSYGVSPTTVAGHWRHTLLNLGIKPFDDTLQAEALRHSRPDTNLRFDLRKRKRAFKTPTKADLFFTDNTPQPPETSYQQRRVIEKELQAFKKIHHDFRKAGSVKKRSEQLQRKYMH